MPYQPAANRYQAMVYRRYGRSGLQLPAISMGLWHSFGEGASLECMRGLLFRAFDLGITHFDLANNYGPPPGAAEENLGRILTTDLVAHRDEVILSTKAGYPMWPGPYGEWGSRKYLLASLDQSLRRLRTDYVDIFYSHRFDPDTPLEETMGALVSAVQRGKALYVGVSSYSARKTAEAAALLRDYLISDEQQALAIDKSSALSNYVLGCTLAKLDQRDQAELHLRRAAELDPKYTQAR